MIRFFLLTVVTVFVSLAVYLYFYLGVFKTPSFELEHRPPLRLLYKSHLGPYHEIGSTIHEVELWAQDHHVPCTLTFGEYIDDPDTVDEDRLRSRGGCVLDSHLDESPESFTFEERAAQDALVGRFDGSPSIGPFKVYPAAKRFLNEHHLSSKAPVIEIYHVNGNNVTTEYLFPLDSPFSG